ncbi:hypothetical protein PPL_09160 [Heterostelium album PN500]|uniref:Polymorphic outer membrane protein n=1 Tax=Heterostelium pallidum (strain ATCC 26659 / Pp 5 / PN500) TaxID=670386 RepID=D3BKS8_HETP5|nr:hypothetical protein PPL_09160 [Heterostelium album PN500]EFA78508.1 hypothetical protein PPL_09160 [Heterostelium album PN500]|eukprot:XP_020430632.1 hypothetical protein PPL_09160 [Heterostelium album PN500]
MNTISLFITFLVFLLVSGSSQAITQCYFDKNVNSCKSVNARMHCPSIEECLSTFGDSYGTYEVIIQDGNYNSEDCPGLIEAPISMNGSLTFKTPTVDKYANFNCGDSQFISINLQNYMVLNFTNLILSGSSQDRGGCVAIYVGDQEATVYFTNVKSIHGCTSQREGGFLYSQAIRNIFYNSYIANCQSQYSDGGAIHANITYLFSSTFENNVAAQSGGVAAGSKIFSSNSNFIGNSAQDGGCLSATTVMSVFNSSLISNSAINTGGALYATCYLTIDVSTFENCSASNGGAIYVESGMTIFNSVFDSNQALYEGSGGAIFFQSLDNTSISVFTTNFTNNWSGGKGGVIFIDSGSLYLQQTIFKNNSAVDSGGIIYGVNGPNLQVFNIFTSQFNDSYSGNNGGVMCSEQRYEDEEIVINLLGSTFNGNTASNYAGGIYFEQMPQSLIGGIFSNSKSSEKLSSTFYSNSILQADIVNVTNTDSTTLYQVPIYIESSFEYWKAIGVQGECYDGYATIDEFGNVLTCKCFPPAQGSTCQLN